MLIGFWEQCMIFYQRNLLPYKMGYNIFSMFQRVIILVALINIFWWLYAVLWLLFCMFVLQYIVHFTIWLLLYYLIKNEKNRMMISLMLFSAMVWITAILTIVSFFIK